MVVTERFDRRLAEVEEFMAQRSRRHATRVVNEIIRRISTLATLPRRGRAVPEIQDVDTREVIVDDYRVMYAVKRRRAPSRGADRCAGSPAVQPR